MILIDGGPGTIAYNLDVFAAFSIYITINIMASMIMYSDNSLNDKFKLISTPLSILFVGIIIALLVRTLQSSPSKL